MNCLLEDFIKYILIIFVVDKVLLICEDEMLYAVQSVRNHCDWFRDMFGNGYILVNEN